MLEVTQKQYFRHGDAHPKHQARLYRIWGNIIQRCENPNNTCYKRYCGRGIGICKEWRNSYPVFKDWALSHGYADNLTIDRKENDGNYEPKNCRWISSPANSAKMNHDKALAIKRGFLSAFKLGYTLGKQEKLLR